MLPILNMKKSTSQITAFANSSSLLQCCFPNYFQERKNHYCITIYIFSPLRNCMGQSCFHYSFGFVNKNTNVHSHENMQTTLIDQNEEQNL